MKSQRYQVFSLILIPRLALFSLLLLSSLPGISSSRIFTLGSIEIYTTHEWLPTKPTIYLKCQGGSKTALPDAREKRLLYIFKELLDKKCQRCGFYEEDAIKSDDVFDEWVFCASDFVAGRYVWFEEKEFNATFICPECAAAAADSNQTVMPTKEEQKNLNVIMITLISLLAATVATGGAYIIYRYWQKRKRQHDQARFLKAV